MGRAQLKRSLPDLDVSCTTHKRRDRTGGFPRDKIICATIFTPLIATYPLQKNRFLATMSRKSIDALVSRATSETLTSDNWQYILEVCDAVTADPETNIKSALKAVQTRMALKDANVTLRTCSLIAAMGENCGSRMRQEIATKAFLQETFLKKLGDRKLHRQVKEKVAEVIVQLHQLFRDDPLLKPMADAYNTVNSQYRQYVVSQGPDKPAKKEMSQLDKANEEKELQRALQVSLQEYEREQLVRQKPLPSVTQNTQQNAAPRQNVAPEKLDSSQTIASVSKVRALYDLISYEPDELSFRKGDIITVIESVYRDWWRGLLTSGKVGIFPLNYVTPVVTRSPQELQKESELESSILSTELKKVNRLLAMLSLNPETINEDEITQLYNEVVPIRPTLAKFIDKHSARKEELSTLHGQLNAEVKLYNDLVDKMISQRTNPAPSGPLPYPVQQPIAQQPTSAGFGNAGSAPRPEGNRQQYLGAPPTSFGNQGPGGSAFSGYPAPNYSQNGPHSQYGHQPPTTFNQPQEPEQYLNVGRFPEVNSLN